MINTNLAYRFKLGSYKKAKCWKSHFDLFFEFDAHIYRFTINKLDLHKNTCNLHSHTQSIRSVWTRQNAWERIQRECNKHCDYIINTRIWQPEDKVDYVLSFFVRNSLIYSVSNVPQGKGERATNIQRHQPNARLLNIINWIHCTVVGTSRIW